jgi:hypothetical protein
MKSTDKRYKLILLHLLATIFVVSGFVVLVDSFGEPITHAILKSRRVYLYVFHQRNICYITVAKSKTSMDFVPRFGIERPSSYPLEVRRILEVDWIRGGFGFSIGREFIVRGEPPSALYSVRFPSWFMVLVLMISGVAFAWRAKRFRSLPLATKASSDRLL